jgi:hypothetical protein
MRKISVVIAIGAACMWAGACLFVGISVKAAILAPSITLVSSIGDLPVTRGTVTLNGATPITVVAPLVTPNSSVHFTLKTVGGTVGAVPAIQTITVGVGFTVAGTAGDTSSYNFDIVF